MIPPAFRRLAGAPQRSALAMPVTVTMDGTSHAVTPDGRPLHGIWSEEREFMQTTGNRQVAVSAPVFTLAAEDLPRDPKRADTIASDGRTFTIAQVLRAPLGKWDCLLTVGKPAAD